MHRKTNFSHSCVRLKPRVPLVLFLPLDASSIETIKPLFSLFWGQEDHEITPPTQVGSEGSVRLLLTKNPDCSLSCLLPARYEEFHLNGFLGHGR